jgi:hypothetical protein
MLWYLTMSVKGVLTEYKQSVDNFGGCIWYHPRPELRLLCIIKVLAASIGNLFNVVATTWQDERQQSVKTASTEHQHRINDFGYCIVYNPWAVLLHLPIIEVLAVCRGNMVMVNLTTPENERQQSINRASTILGVASCIIQGPCYDIYPISRYWLLL